MQPSLELGSWLGAGLSSDNLKDYAGPKWQHMPTRLADELCGRLELHTPPPSTKKQKIKPSAEMPHLACIQYRQLDHLRLDEHAEGGEALDAAGGAAMKSAGYSHCVKLSIYSVDPSNSHVVRFPTGPFSREKSRKIEVP